MRILQLGKYYPPYKGGIETHLQSLITHLRDEVSFEVIVSNTRNRTESEVLDGVPVTRLRCPIRISSAPINPGLRARIRRSAADLVHLHHPNPGATIAYLSTGRDDLVLSWHGDAVRQRVLGLAFQPVLKAALDRARAIVVATPEHVTTTPMLTKYADRCQVVPYGVDVEECRQADPETVESLRKRYGPFVLAVGRLVYYKGFDILIRAMKGAPAKLVIIGEGPLGPSLQAEISRLGLDGRVVILGGVEDVRPYYAACEVFVLPSVARSEAFGIVQLEAMAAGRPVINTRLQSGVPAVSLDRITGLTVQPGSVEELREALAELLANGDLRVRYGAAGLARVREEFTTEIMARRMLAVYRSVS